MVTATTASAAPQAPSVSALFIERATQDLLAAGRQPAAANKARHLQLVEDAQREIAAGDCPECDGTGEGPFDTACGGCRGRGYFGSAS